jgi:hypothetical protein
MEFSLEWNLDLICTGSRFGWTGPALYPNFCAFSFARDVFLVLTFEEKKSA